jgi:alkylhydroperoxidase family enzyme
VTARIAPAPPPHDDKTQGILDRIAQRWGPPFLMFKVLAREPRLFQSFIAGSVGYLEPSHITVRQREVLLLRVTALAGCEYEWGIRVHFYADDAWLTEPQVAATVSGDHDSADWTPEDTLLLSLAEELHATCTISDALWPRLAASFTDEAILQLVMLAGYYRTVAYLTNGLKLPLEPMGKRCPEDA